MSSSSSLLSTKKAFVTITWCIVTFALYQSTPVLINLKENPSSSSSGAPSPSNDQILSKKMNDAHMVVEGRVSSSFSARDSGHSDDTPSDEYVLEELISPHSHDKNGKKDTKRYHHRRLKQTSTGTKVFPHRSKNKSYSSSRMIEEEDEMMCNNPYWNLVGEPFPGFGAVNFGNDWNVALSADGNMLILGAFYGGAVQGRVRVFQRDASSPLGWIQVGGNLDGDSGDGAGISVAISNDGSVIAFGAMWGGGGRRGRVRIFGKDDTAALGWSSLGIIDGDASEDWSGKAIALSSNGDIIAISGHKHDGNGKTNSGQVRVFASNATAALGWTQLGDDLNGNESDDLAGWSIALSDSLYGLTVAFGAIGGASSTNRTAYVKVFKRNLTSLTGWSQEGEDILGENTYDSFGYSVALSSNGNTLAIGARFSTNGVQVFQRDSTTDFGWLSVGNPIAQFGYSVSLSADGNILAVGSEYGGDYGTGLVTFFKADASSDDGWKQVGRINGETDPNGRSGGISLSANGQVVSIGALWNRRLDEDNSWVYYGYARVFEVSCPSANPSKAPIPSPSTIPSLIPSISMNPSLSSNPSLQPSATSSKSPAISQNEPFKNEGESSSTAKTISAKMSVTLKMLYLNTLMLMHILVG